MPRVFKLAISYPLKKTVLSASPNIILFLSCVRSCYLFTTLFEHHFEPKAYYIVFVFIYLKIIEMRLYHGFVGVCLFMLVR